MSIVMSFATIKQALLAENPSLRLDPGQRFQNLDLLKMVCLFLVIVAHCGGGSITLHPSHPGLWTVTQFLYYSGVVTIPTFFMASGYQLLGRKNLTYGYVAVKILKLVRASAVLYLLLRAVEDVCFHDGIVLREYPLDFICSLFRIPGWDMFAFWFIGALILVYMFSPLLNRVYTRHKSAFLWLSVGLVLYSNVVFCFTIVFPADNFMNESSVLIPFRLWCWLCYFCLGGLVKRYSVFRSLGKTGLVVGLCAAVYLFIFFCESRRGIGWLDYYYVSLPVIACVVAIFMYSLRFTVDSDFIRKVMPLFFSIYLIDCTMLYFLNPVGLELSATAYTLINIVLNVVCSVAAAWLLMKVPLMRCLLKL